ncbi:TonB-dependent receptor [Marinomonas mediterranea]|jgi:TonB-dependent siderophore receptor|uniref:TonB-dependent siderophore receptor n=1 Tax=Marinomonas mediterranea (strain ATCC 700492 / JCM 21426 / NBRC 103028 / MMB-1) TaxID=717774 RepID=F2JYE6_MARM1|nr:TonB-dependent siderophore receptor [Marinomonas mediterranea]ADZ91977.1 TonB-dependent siderophore receptor [Marinomonas mediterranea MMB-1]WCN18056.1 TonB-dependent siderophore receptor [Marinomonas mediterranea MMB-1]
MSSLHSQLELHQTNLNSKHKKSAQTEQSSLFKKTALSLAIAASAAYLYSPSVLAETETETEKASDLEEDKSSVTLPVLKVVSSKEKKPVYSGTDGQVLDSNHTGFLGDKDPLDTPFSAIGYTEKYIENIQANDISDVISTTDPAVYTSNTSGESRESYAIRGFTSNSNDATVNGLAGMAPYYRSATEMYESVEVLKGPSAMLNGMAPNGSVGGTINLTMKRAHDEPLTQLTTKYISDSQIGASFDVGRRFGEANSLGIRVNGAFLSGDGTIDHQENESQLGSIGLDWRGDRTKISADIYQTKENVDAPTRGVTVASGVDIPSPPSTDTLLNPSWAFYENETKGAMIQGEHEISKQLSVYAKTGVTKWNYTGLSADSAEIINSAGDIETTLGGVSDDTKRTALEIGLNGEFTTGSVIHEIATNVTRYDETYNLYAGRFGGVTINSNIYNPDWGTLPDGIDLNFPLLLTTETTLTSFGLADTLSFAEDKYQLTLGARHQQVKTAQTGGMLSAGTEYDKSAVTPSAALVIKLTDDISVYANYIEGLNKGDTAPTTARGGATVPENAGEIFSPYKTKQKEVGLKLDQGLFTHTISLYEIEKPSSYTDTDTNIFGYYGEQRNRGLEWNFFGSPLDNLRLMGGLAYIDAELTATSGGSNDGNQAAGVPDWQAKLGAEWDTSFVRNLTLTANANSVSSQYLNADNGSSISGYTIFDVGARYATTIAQLPVTIRANIKNLADKEAWTTASYNDLGLVEGRSVNVSASVNF